ncbi:MAG TPA: hypothetical protein VL550_08605 [Rhodocyclaceae bacterium]|jgi:predicted permease|nr:hypothetical protein [Rhodocyclaceae bacterium]
MSLSLFAPLLYLFAGICMGRSPVDIRKPASALLSKAVIPLVIIYNIATYKPGIVVVVLGTISMMGVMAALGRLFIQDAVRRLGFFYFNIGWLGLPVAAALFGDGAASLFIAAYIGSTIFGNSIGALMLAGSTHQKSRVLRVIQSPPVLAVLIGGLLIPFGENIEAHLDVAYGVLKFLLSFLGMAILGIWLAESGVRPRDVREEFFPYVCKLATSCVLITFFVWLCTVLDVQLVTRNVPALYLICLLPPAANIVVLETHYRQSGASAKMIAAGTCISLAAIFVYACLLRYAAT